MAFQMNMVTGFAIENKLVCSTKIAITNCFLYFKDSLDARFGQKLNFAENDKQYYHSFIKLLTLLNFKKDFNKKTTTPIQLTRINCIPRSNKFYFPSNIISLKDHEDLLLKFDDAYEKTEVLNTCSLYNKTENNSHLIEQTSIRIEDAFGSSFACKQKHKHGSCLVKLNEIILTETIANDKYNETSVGISQFDILINWIKLLQLVDFELIAIMYLEILNDQNYSKSMNEIKQKINILNNKITLKDLSYYILFSLRRNNRVYLLIELIECHNSQNIFKQGTMTTPVEQAPHTTQESKILFIPERLFE